MTNLIRQLFARTSMARARAAHLRLGRRGERCACRLLRAMGLTVLTRNLAGPHGEIDIVARDGGVLCFVEVKTRRRSLRSRPADAVTDTKKWRIARTAHRYLRLLGHPPVIYRYDIVEVIFLQGRLHDLRYWPGAFNEDDARRGRRNAGEDQAA